MDRETEDKLIYLAEIRALVTSGKGRCLGRRQKGGFWRLRDGLLHVAQEDARRSFLVLPRDLKLPSSSSAQRKTVGLNLRGDVGKPPLQF